MAMYPVGCIYASTVSTNPATVFGFGTWTAYGEGQVLVGKASAGTFATAGAVVGAETVTLDTTMIPAHGHEIWHFVGNAQTGAINLDDIPGSGNRNVAGEVYMTTTRNAGSGLAHNNLQPSIVTYYFTRTA